METSKNTEGGSNNNEKLLVVGDVGAEGEATTSNATATATDSETKNTKKKNHIQVSNTKKPLVFYLNLAKVLILFIQSLCLSLFSCFILLCNLCWLSY